MRKDGTHTERELKRLDERLDDKLEKLIEDVDVYKDDRVGMVFAYGRPDGDDQKGESTVGVCVHGDRTMVTAALAAVFEDKPELFLDVLKAVTAMHPDKFAMFVKERPKPNGIVS